MKQEELLQLVQWIAGDDPPVKDAEKKLSLIYRLVHGFQDGCCKGFHQDWRDESEKLLTELKKLGEI